MLEDVLWHAAVLDALDHGGMVPCVVTEYLAPWQLPGQGEEGGVVGHITGGEDEGSLIVVQGGQLRLKLLVY